MPRRGVTALLRYGVLSEYFLRCLYGTLLSGLIRGTLAAGVSSSPRCSVIRGSLYMIVEEDGAGVARARAQRRTTGPGPDKQVGYVIVAA